MSRSNATATHCVNNHEFTPENTYIYPPGSRTAGQKVCKVCRQNAHRKRAGLPPLERDSVRPWNRNKTHCPAGHEYTPENTYVASGQRHCRICARDQRIRRSYGVEPAQFDKLWKRQKGACAICRIPFIAPLSDSSGERAHVDHHHTTGAVRGLLCSNCNNGLGRFNDSVEALRAAAKYITRFETN